MIRLFRQLFHLFSPRERWQFIVLSFVLLLRAVAEMVGVASIGPFMSVVGDPTIIQRNAWMHRTYEALGSTTVPGFLTALGVLVVVVLVTSNAISALAVWAMLRFSWGTYHRVSTRLLSGYLAQPYSFFVERNSTSLSKNILVETRNLIDGVVKPVLNIISRSLVIAALAALLIVLDPLLAGVVVVVLGGTYTALYLLVRARQRQLGRARLRANEVKFRVIEETLGGIKDVKVLGREAYCEAEFAPASWALARASAFNDVVAHVPRYAFEAVAFGSLIFIVLYLLHSGADLAAVLPVVSLYAFAGYRMMPELQQLFVAFGQVLFHAPTMDELCADLDRCAVPPRVVRRPSAVPFRHAVQFDDVTFTHGGAETASVRDVSFTIRRNQTVGLVGQTGSGKSTLMDLLLGLYTPDQGKILVDALPLAPENVAAWRLHVGYVPQHIFLCDDTIAGNIAFGVPKCEIDMEKVERAARAAQLDGFIRSLPDGYAAVVGERGVRLSGGQRQRIGIARALYEDPDVLMMDEATSALDSETESAVMGAIRSLAGRKTIISIAHRLTTVRDSDTIVLLDEGRVAAVGTYDELLQGSTMFRRLASVRGEEQPPSSVESSEPPRLAAAGGGFVGGRR